MKKTLMIHFNDHGAMTHGSLRMEDGSRLWNMDSEELYGLYLLLTACTHIHVINLPTEDGGWYEMIQY